jgi:anti-sigma regulatory factor (Ser/Thr protein kinase)
MTLALDEVGRAGWRSEIRGALVGSLPQETVEDIILVAGELVANAVEHGLPPASLELAAEAGGPVVVSVHDHGAPVPLVPAAFAQDAVRGRGLVIVDALTTEWGVRETEHGKEVWARVAPQDEARS